MTSKLSKVLFTSAILLSIGACGGRSKPERNDQPVAPSESAPAQAAAESTPVDPNTEIGSATPSTKGEVTYEGADLSKVPQTPSDEVPYADQNTEYVGDVAQQVINQKNDSTAKLSAKPAKQAAATVAKTVGADKVLGWLKNGNSRFVKRRVRADGQSPADRARLLSGQNPHAIVFTCSDSRVPPEIIFDQKLGEIYVVRTEQLSVTPDVVMSLEKGAALGAQLLVVLSYNGCAADAVKGSGGLTTQSATLAELENTGKLKIQPATYDLKTGIVKFE